MNLTSRIVTAASLFALAAQPALAYCNCQGNEPWDDYGYVEAYGEYGTDIEIAGGQWVILSAYSVESCVNIDLHVVEGPWDVAQSNTSSCDENVRFWVEETGYYTVYVNNQDGRDTAIALSAEFSRQD